MTDPASAAPLTRAQLIDAIEADPRSRAIYRRAQAMIDTHDPAHDLEHALRVTRWAAALYEGDPALAFAAALLHDLINVPKDSDARAQASERSAEAARALLQEAGFEPTEIASITAAIRDHSFSRGAVPQDALGDALQDADRLEALGAIGICRTLSTGAKMGAHYFDAADPWAEQRELRDRAYSVDHFFTKLLKLHEGFRTRAGRAEAARRTEFMRAFLAQLARELR